MPVQGVCTRCGYIASNRLCKACVLLESLQRQKQGQQKLEMGDNSGRQEVQINEKSTEKKSLNVSW